MAFDTQTEWDRLSALTIGQLREEHTRIFGWLYQTGNRKTLSRRICWKLREMAEGGLSDRAKQRAREIAAVSLVREIPPPGWPETGVARETEVHSPERDPRIPAVGSVLRREHKGKSIVVTVRENGFEYGGDIYRSLSAVARAATRTQWSGYRFFKLDEG